MKRLTEELERQFEESEKLKEQILNNIAHLDYGDE